MKNSRFTSSNKATLIAVLGGTLGGVVFFHYGLDEIKDFVNQNTQFKFPNGLLKNEMGDPKANLICLDCFDFYKSKALHRFVRKMERELRE